MIAWFSKNKVINLGKINYNNLKNIIELIKNENNHLCKYVTQLFAEYQIFLKQNYKEARLITNNLKETYKDNFVDCSNSIRNIKNNKIILSPSHDNTYYILKELNCLKNHKVLVICFDMHSDTYNYNDNLWKGNVFSKLLKEDYINSLLVIGISHNKVKNIKQEINNDLKNKIFFSNNIKKYLKKLKPTNVFISIDIDCLNTRESKYTALEYCPNTILTNISMLSLNDISKENIVKKIKECIFVKNELGYANLYKVGENNFNFNQIKKIIADIKRQCHKLGINLGFNYKNHILADITELNGYDYGKLTTELIVKLINELI